MEDTSTKIILISILMGLTFISNSLGMLALYKRKVKGGKLTRMYFFLFHLFITDIIITFSTLLPELIMTTLEISWTNSSCKIVKFVQMFGPYLSSYVLVMIAMDRFQAICYPMNHYFWQPSRSKQKIITAWILAFCLGIPHGILFRKTGSDSSAHDSNACSAQIGQRSKGML